MKFTPPPCQSIGSKFRDKIKTIKIDKNNKNIFLISILNCL